MNLKAVFDSPILALVLPLIVILLISLIGCLIQGRRLRSMPPKAGATSDAKVHRRAA